MKPRALDLFCGAGGVSMGLHLAGFEVTGVDIKRQPHYPFRFAQMDATDWNHTEWFSQFDFIWASPPCQAHTALKTMHNAKPHVDLIAITRGLLRVASRPWVMENVGGAPLKAPVMLCGTMFNLGTEDAELRRHRYFEMSSQFVSQPNCYHGLKPSVIGIYGGHVRNRRRREGSHARGVADFSIDAGKRAMEIDWMTLTELSQAIPPAYSYFIGDAVRRSLVRAA